jgi:hypothetical protein
MMKATTASYLAAIALASCTAANHAPLDDSGPGSGTGSSGSAGEILDAQRPPLLGVFTDGYGPAEKEANVEALESYLGIPGGSLTVLAYGNNSSWSGFESGWGWAIGNWRSAGPSRVINWSVPLTVNGSPLSEVASGADDSYFLHAAQQIAQYYPQAIIRIGWEMNLTYSTWSAVGHEQDYIAAFRRVAGIFRGVSSQFRFDWCPNIGTQGVDPERVYPGDDAVDIIGIDYYDDNWGSPEQRWDWNFNGDARGLEWHAQFAAAHGKPMSFPEFGVGKGGDTPYFITKLYAWATSHDVVYMNYWDSNSDYPGAIHDNTYPQVGAEFRNTFALFATSSASGLPGEPVPTGQIAVSDQQTGLCWDTLGSTTTLAQWSCNSGANQRFDLLKYADGSYALRNAITGRCVDNGGSAENGSAVGMDTCGKPGEGQFWVWANGRGGTSISNKASSKCVEPGWNNVTQGQQAFIQWDCWGGINQSFDVAFTSGGY